MDGTASEASSTRDIGTLDEDENRPQTLNAALKAMKTIDWEGLEPRTSDLVFCLARAVTTLNNKSKKQTKELAILESRLSQQQTALKNWTDHLTKSFEHLQGDVKERGMITTTLSEKLMEEVSAQQNRCNRIERIVQSSIIPSAGPNPNATPLEVLSQHAHPLQGVLESVTTVPQVQVRPAPPLKLSGAVPSGGGGALSTLSDQVKLVGTTDKMSNEVRKVNEVLTQQLAQMAKVYEEAMEHEVTALTSKVDKFVKKTDAKLQEHKTNIDFALRSLQTEKTTYRRNFEMLNKRTSVERVEVTEKVNKVVAKLEAIKQTHLLRDSEQDINNRKLTTELLKKSAADTDRKLAGVLAKCSAPNLALERRVDALYKEIKDNAKQLTQQTGSMGSVFNKVLSRNEQERYELQQSLDRVSLEVKSLKVSRDNNAKGSKGPRPGHNTRTNGTIGFGTMARPQTADNYLDAHTRPPVGFFGSGDPWYPPPRTNTRHHSVPAMQRTGPPPSKSPPISTNGESPFPQRTYGADTPMKASSPTKPQTARIPRTTSTSHVKRRPLSGTLGRKGSEQALMYRSRADRDDGALGTVLRVSTPTGRTRLPVSEADETNRVKNGNGAGVTS